METIVALCIGCFVLGLIVGHLSGYSKCMATQRNMASIAIKLIMANNYDRAVRVLKVGMGVRTKQNQKDFKQRLAELDEKET